MPGELGRRPQAGGEALSHLTSVSCSSLRIVYLRIFCRLLLIRMPVTVPMTMNSRMPTTAAMMDVTGLQAGAKVRDWGPGLGSREEGAPWRGMKVTGLEREFRRVAHWLLAYLPYFKELPLAPYCPQGKVPLLSIQSSLPTSPNFLCLYPWPSPGFSNFLTKLAVELAKTSPTPRGSDCGDGVGPRSTH